MRNEILFQQRLRTLSLHTTFMCHIMNLADIQLYELHPSTNLCLLCNRQRRKRVQNFISFDNWIYFRCLQGVPIEIFENETFEVIPPLGSSCMYQE